MVPVKMNTGRLQFRNHLQLYGNEVPMLWGYVDSSVLV